MSEPTRPSINYHPRWPRSVRALFLALTLGLIPSAWADHIPDFGSANYYHASKDMRLVTAEFKFKETNDPSLLLSIPRAYINFAPEYYEKNGFKEIPDQITVRSISMHIWMPTMEAWIPAYFGGISQLSAKDRRNGLASVKLQFLRQNFAGILEYYRSTGKPLITANEAMPVKGLMAERHHNMPHRVYYTSRDKKFPFEYIECPSQPTGGHWCTYSFCLCPSLGVSADLTDFRTQGGLPFALEQHRKLKSLVDGWSKNCGEA